MGNDVDSREIGDEIEYHGYKVGRPTRTVEVKAPNGMTTIKEGRLHFRLAVAEDIRRACADGGWTSHYVSPDGGIGFGCDPNNPGGIALRFDLEGVITFDEPTTKEDVGNYLEENRDKWELFVDETIESDTTAADILEVVR